MGQGFSSVGRVFVCRAQSPEFTPAWASDFSTWKVEEKAQEFKASLETSKNKIKLLIKPNKIIHWL